MSFVFSTVLLTDAGKGCSIWVDNKEALLSGSIQNQPAEENHSGLRILLVPQFLLKWM